MDTSYPASAIVPASTSHAGNVANPGWLWRHQVEGTVFEHHAVAPRLFA